jgi:hypothetical protein
MTMSSDFLRRQYDAFVEDLAGDTRVQTRDESFDTITESLRTGEISPIYDQHVESTLASAATGVSASYYYYIDMDGYRTASIQVYSSASAADDGWTIFTVEATDQDDGTAAASCSYVDITSKIFGTSSVTAGYSTTSTVSDMFIQQTGVYLPCKYLRVKVDASGIGVTWFWNIYAKKMF